MALAMIKTQQVCIYRMFVWEIESFRFDDLKVGIKSPTMTAADPYNGTKYTGVFNFHERSYNEVSFSIDISPDPGIIEYFYMGKNGNIHEGQIIQRGFKMLFLYVNVISYRHEEPQLESPPCPLETFNTLEKLKQLWKVDPSAKFLIKCKGATIEAIKPIMAAYSPVFKVMFDGEWNESTQNTVEITDFAPGVVQKMVNFCENGTLNDLTECEEIYKIADKYDIPELMKLALSKFTETTTIGNVRSRLQIAKQFEMEDFKKWCMRFCVQNDIYDF